MKVKGKIESIDIDGKIFDVSDDGLSKLGEWGNDPRPWYRKPISKWENTFIKKVVLVLLFLPLLLANFFYGGYCTGLWFIRDARRAWKGERI